MGTLSESWWSSYGKGKLPTLGGTPTAWALPIFRYPEWQRDIDQARSLVSEYEVLKGLGGKTPQTTLQRVIGTVGDIIEYSPTYFIASEVYALAKQTIFGKPKVEKPARYKGEDEYGFGIHSNGTIDCINIPLCSRWTIGTTRSLRSLWDLESTSEERLAEDNQFADGFKAMMRRLLVTVVVENISHYDLTKLPTTHMVVVLGGAGSGIAISDGAHGLLMARRSIDRVSTESASRGAVARQDPSRTSEAEETLSSYDNRARVTERWTNEPWEE